MPTTPETVFTTQHTTITTGNKLDAMMPTKGEQEGTQSSSSTEGVVAPATVSAESIHESSPFMHEAIKRVLKDVHFDVSISPEGVELVDNLLKYFIKALCAKATSIYEADTDSKDGLKLSHFMKSMDESAEDDVEGSTPLLKYELAKHARSEGRKAIQRLGSKSNNSIQIETDSAFCQLLNEYSNINIPIVQIKNYIHTNKLLNEADLPLLRAPAVYDSENKETAIQVGNISQIMTYIAVTCEYICAEVVELSGRQARVTNLNFEISNGRFTNNVIEPISTVFAIEGDEELETLFKECIEYKNTGIMAKEKWKQDKALKALNNPDGDAE